MNRYQKLCSNTVILGIGTFGSKLLVFLLMPLYTAWLTTAEYGAAEMVTSIANFLIPIGRQTKRWCFPLRWRFFWQGLADF